MLNIAVDGTSSSGKGTVCARLAQKLSVVHFDTGAIYRAIGLHVINSKIDPRNEELVNQSLKDINIELKHNDGEQVTILNGVDVSKDIRTSEVSDICSITSSYPLVRQKVLNIQRQSANNCDLIMEGRDITSHVLPNADFKFYIDASLPVRAERRYKDLIKKGETITLQEVEADLKERDRRDMQREVSPLILTEGTIYIDNSEMTIDEEVDLIYRTIVGESR